MTVVCGHEKFRHKWRNWKVPKQKKGVISTFETAPFFDLRGSPKSDPIQTFTEW